MNLLASFHSDSHNKLYIIGSMVSRLTTVIFTNVRSVLRVANNNMRAEYVPKNTINMVFTLHV